MILIKSIVLVYLKMYSFISITLQNRRGPEHVLQQSKTQNIMNNNEAEWY